jgi:hypothetical protein
MPTAKGTPKTTKVRVLVREVGYQGYDEDQLGNTVLVAKRGYGPGQPQLEPTRRLGLDADPDSKKYQEAIDQYKRGEIISIMKDDYDRHKKYGVIMDLADEPDPEEEALEELDVASASVEELSEWIADAKPSVNEVVQASDGDPDLARKLLDAESRAQDGSPRKGVLDGLSTVIGRA